MLNFFKNKKNDYNTKESSFSKIASLLIYAAKVDEVYTKEEEQIIKKTLVDLGAKSSDIDKLILNATIAENKSHQILDFTKEVKSFCKKYLLRKIIMKTLVKNTQENKV